MTDTKPIRRIAIIGTGVIGASWTALFLAKGLQVVATDIAPNAETALRKFVKAAWPALERLGLSPGASQSNLRFTADLARSGCRRRPRPGERARAARFQAEALRAARRAAAARRDHRVELVGAQDERNPVGRRIASRALRHRPSVQSAALDPAGRGRRRGKDLGRDDPARNGVLYSRSGRRRCASTRKCRATSPTACRRALAREVYYLVAEDVLSAADVDDALSWGPGLRWGIMGNMMLNHLGGGPGGIEHFFQQFAGPMTASWKALGSPVLTPEMQKKLIDSVHAEVGSRTIEELEAERDEILLGLLELRTKRRRRSPPRRSHRVASASATRRSQRLIRRFAVLMTTTET